MKSFSSTLAMRSLVVRSLVMIVALAATSALADDAKVDKEARVDKETQRDINQQERIEQGLKSGELNTKEASKLEREQGHVDSMEAKAMSDGKVSKTEAARINAAQDKASADVYAQKHDAQKGNPDSASSQRMQADVQRNVNQEQRIQAGQQSGALTDKESAKLQAGQAHVDRKEARAGADGHVSASDERKVQRSENHQSHKIARKKHNGRTDDKSDEK